MYILLNNLCLCNCYGGCQCLELIPVRHQHERNKPRFLLDEGIQPKYSFKLAPKFLPLRAIARPGSPDWIVLERAKEMELIVITEDKGFIARAISEGEVIIYQTEWGDRFEVRSRLIETGCRSKKWVQRMKGQKLKQLAKYQYIEYYFL